MSRTIVLIAFLVLALFVVLPSCKDSKQPGSESQSQVVPPSAVQTEPPENLSVDSLPRPLKTVLPAYPDSARRHGIEGAVYIKAIVDEQGNVRKAVVDHRVDGVPEFETAALEAAKQWTFTPALKDNKAVAVWVVLPFRFKLQAK